MAGAEPEGQTPDLSRIPIIPERWISAWDTTSNLDSPAFWQGNGNAWVVATAKGTHELWVYDAVTGEILRRVGSPGAALGEFARPNGIYITGDLVLVVERDNHRIQVMHLPGFRSLGAFGEDVLQQPYGVAAFGDPATGMDVYITDDYGNEEDPPEGQDPSGDFTRRVSHFRVTVDRGRSSGEEGARVEAQLVRQFGEAAGPGALIVVESIQVDEAQGLLVVADEHNLELELYDLAGNYRGETVAEELYRHGDPEGIMLYRCGQAGYWILTDQGDMRSVFHILDRATFEHLGSFAGEVTANTDGIWLTQARVSGLGAGALFALHDDGGLTAFAWEDIGRTLGLETGCGG
ncbi:MAG: phytase [Gemmatimonadota bacterium]